MFYGKARKLIKLLLIISIFHAYEICSGASSGFSDAGGDGFSRDSLSCAEEYYNRLSERIRLSRTIPCDSIPDTDAAITKGCSDSIMTIEERNRKMYDDFSERLNRRKFTKLLNKLLLRPERDTTRLDKVVDERLAYLPMAGFTIASVEIHPSNIYNNPKGFVKNAIQATHVRTRRHTIRQDLMFVQGDILDPDLLVRNLRLLRSRSFLYRVNIIVEPVSEGVDSVNVRVESRDRWTIGAGGRINAKGRAYAEISDANFLGFGNKLKYRLSMDWRKWEYHGSMFGYDITNLFGTFYGAEIDVGRSYDHRIASILVNKKILVANDYGLGARYTDEQLNYHFIKANASDTIRYREIDLWAGFSRQLPKSPLSVYSMLRGYSITYFNRDRIDLGGEPLVVDAYNNPYFHNRNILLASVGVYFEKLPIATNVFQYGVKEHIPVGFNSQVIMGYMEGEYHSGPYLGVSVKRGGFTKIGYFMQSISYGTFYSELTRKAYQSSFNFEFDYFTNLIKSGRFMFRHFVWFSYTNGWNRTDGSNEVLVFTAQSGPRALRENFIGKKRVTLNNETVIFTPWAPAGFRVVVFGFADMGLIGNHNNIFKNEFYASVGLGIRLRNERLVFKTLQLRLSVGFGKVGLIKNDWFKLSTSARMESMSYAPAPPVIIPYE